MRLFFVGLLIALFVAGYQFGKSFVEILGAVGEWAIVFVIYLEFEGARRGHQLGAALAVLQELHEDKAYRARIYIMEKLPSIKGLSELEIASHQREIRPAIMAFHTAGFFMKTATIEKDLQAKIMAFIWATTWRCWKKSGEFVKHEAELRKDASFMQYFEPLYELCEKHRRENKLDELPLKWWCSGSEQGGAEPSVRGDVRDSP